MARWQSGYAAACKAVYLGSIPGRASSVLLGVPCGYKAFNVCPGGEIGRHKGLKIPRRKLYRFDSGPGHQTLLKWVFRVFCGKLRNSYDTDWNYPHDCIFIRHSPQEN